MKKVLSAALALGMVAGVATTASAAFDNFRVRGYYDLEGMYGSNMKADGGVNLGTTGNDVGESSAAWYQQNFRLYPVIEVNDKIKMSSEVRLMDDDIWGEAGTGTAGQRDVDINKLYMEWTMNYGTLRMGRVPFGAYGHNFINSSTRADAFVYFSNLLPKPFGFTVVAGKAVEADGQNAVTDADTDYYDVRFNYTTDTVNVHTRGALMRNMGTATMADNNYRWDGFGTIKFMDNMYVDFEWEKTFGDKDYDSAATTDLDYDALALMAKVGGNFGALDAGLTTWYVSGDDDTTDNDLEAFSAGSKKDFAPLMIMTGADTSLLSNDTSTGYFATKNIGSNHGAIGLVANFGYKVNDKLALTSAIGTAWTAEDEFRTSATTVTKREDGYGYEIDLGLEYKLLDNLTYRANFGYWDAGDFFTDGTKTVTSGVEGAATGMTEEDDVIMLTHGLNMTF